jgi:outer membrane protein assembly factor BamB
MHRFLIISMGLLLLCGSATAGEEAAMLRNWPAWRGPLANGVAPEANPPMEWSETNNVRWKIAMPGKGRSGPIVFGDKVFVTATVPTGKILPPVFDDMPGVHDSVPVTQRHQFTVTALDRATGKVIWTKIAKEDFPHEGGHYTGSLASNSPVTDGELLIVSFGSRGLYCYDFNGKLIWQKDLGRMHTLHSHGKGVHP